MVNGFDKFANGYVTEVAFLPNDGYLYVDKCGLKWVGKQECNVECWNAQKERIDRKSTRLNSSHIPLSRMPSSA